MSLDIQSNASPLATVDCTGLLTGVPGAPYTLCNPATPLWQNNTVSALPNVSQSVWDLAGELNAPLVRDRLRLNLAGRYTEYSTSGAVQTWKAGLDWHIADNVSLRATSSVDIRAPTLFDFYARITQGIQSFSDTLHTGVTGQNYAVSQGNTALVPEVSRTYTAGALFTPDFIPDLTASVDYYTIVLKNAITNLSGGNISIQKLCEDSGGVSPYCGLIVRPLSFSDRSAANFPTQILSQPVNTAFNKLEGVDMEINYRFELASLAENWPGAVSMRALGNIQPVNQAIPYTGAPLTFTSYPNARLSLFAGYASDGWTVSVLDRWISGFSKATQFGQVYAEPRVSSINYIDLSLEKRFQAGDAALSAYLSVQNILDQRPRVNPTNSTNPGLYFMGVQGSTTSLYDAVGRYFTLGVRAEL
jgi:outer membrane receptor protein involved in Fe transport